MLATHRQWSIWRAIFVPNEPSLSGRGVVSQGVCGWELKCFGSFGVHASARRVARPRCAGHGQPVVTGSGFGGLVGGYDATGTSLYERHGATSGLRKALSWFLRASALGDANADVGLGYLVDAELVDDSELQPAEYWYRRAAMANSVEGQLRWARWLLANGEIRQATTWFAAAANQNHAQGHNDLAWLLATQRNAALRNGSRALSHARLAVQAEASVDTLILLRQPWLKLVNSSRPSPPNSARLRLWRLTIPDSKLNCSSG
ncbi:MAG: hypothetical protein CM15mP120_23320 [Pseudomonadota bacterium]|nr:MAG: hypothetical protein CM15mP120_23320 [Pseudomonadota bacterium]